MRATQFNRFRGPHSSGSGREAATMGGVFGPWLKGLLRGVLALPLLLSACQSLGGKDTIAKLRNTHIEIKEANINGGLDKAMESYRRFLAETPESSKLKPEAIRRLADLKIEQEYGILSGGDVAKGPGTNTALTPPVPAASQKVAGAGTLGSPPAKKQETGESQKAFEQRASGPAGGAAAAPASGEDQEEANARDAIALYQKLLKEYPGYDRNDQVLYQMSRAYDELGQVDDAMQVMDRMVREYPKSRYINEVQFRRAEYFFMRKHYLDAEDAYKSIVQRGATSIFFQLALYKLGWTFYKQELYDESLDRFIALLDYKVSMGYDFSQTTDKAERQRIDDTFRVVSLCFSNLGGATSVSEYFKQHGKRSYEESIYSNLGEYYFKKRRYSDAAATYNAFVSSNPFHARAPQFDMRVIDIDIAGGFPSLVIDAKKQFVKNYGLKAEYWKHFDPGKRPEVMGWLKKNITDLAKNYHALFQSPQNVKDKKKNFEEARHWYREFLATFPKDPESPSVNYLLADLLLENGSFDQAAREYEKTAYDYPRYEKSSQAGYAAVYAWRQYLAGVPADAQDAVKREVVRSSLKFVDTYPEHEKAPIVLGAAADDLYNMHDYEKAVAVAQRLIETFPKAEEKIVRSAWLVVGHSTYELHRFSEAEAAYGKVLAMLPAGDKSREALTDNLASAIYKQGEQANVAKDYRTAVGHFLRVGRVAPHSKIRVNAEYDAATALIQLKDWKEAATVLLGFRKLFPGHTLQPKVTEKLAYVYRADRQYSRAADEYERIEKESKDERIRREALMTAAALHVKAGNPDSALTVYRRYIAYFPHPVEANLEARTKIADLLKKDNEQERYLAELRKIVTLDAGAGKERTARTRYLAGKAALVFAEQSYDRFAAVKLVKPFKANLNKKKKLMKIAISEFNKLLRYEDGAATAASTYYLAEIYECFSKDLRESERPTGLSALEKEEYELAIEDQAYPFEEKAIATHKKNLELISLGVYNEWIDKSLQKLAKFSPARYDKPEEESPVIASVDTYRFAVASPEVSAAKAAEAKETAKAPEVKEAANAEVPKQEAKQAEVKEAAKSGEPKQEAKPAKVKEAATAGKPKREAKPTSVKEATKTEKPKKETKPVPVKEASKAKKLKQETKPTRVKEAAKTGKQAARTAETKLAVKSGKSSQNAGDRGAKGSSPETVKQ